MGERDRFQFSCCFAKGKGAAAFGSHQGDRDHPQRWSGWDESFNFVDELVGSDSAHHPGRVVRGR